jgi:hypothetical protein
MKVAALVTVLIALFSGPALAQRTPQEARTAQQGVSWFLLSSTICFHDRLSVYLELQPRAAGFITSMQQLLTRGALNFHLNADVTFSLGYAYVETWPYGEFPAPARFPEHRLWEQAQLNHKMGRVHFQHRARLEQRFIGRMTEGQDGESALDGFDHGNRARYLIRATVPLNRATLEPGAVFLTLYDEIFINFAGPLVQANLFDQNRASLSLGYQATEAVSVQAGYISQFIEKPDGLRFESNHGLLVTLTYNPDLRPLFKGRGG